MRPGAFAAVLCAFAVSAAAAEAVTIRDIVELTRAGLGDDVIVALIEVDGTIFSLDADKLVDLRAQGVSERVLVAMIRSGRPSKPADSPAAETAAVSPPEPVYVPPPPQVVVIEHRDAPAAQPVYVPVPVYVAVPQVPTYRVKLPAHSALAVRSGGSFGRFINDGWRPEPTVVVEPPKKVYWGWGGKRRPDTWKEGG
jgi:hypothetical protein